MIFDDLSDELCRVADLSEFIRLAHPDESISLAAQEACIEVSALVETLNTNTGIYSALRKSVKEGDSFPETQVDKHVAKLFLQDFHQCGIHLGETQRQEVVNITDRILRTGRRFICTIRLVSTGRRFICSIRIVSTGRRFSCSIRLVSTGRRFSSSIRLVSTGRRFSRSIRLVSSGRRFSCSVRFKLKHKIFYIFILLHISISNK